MRPLAQPWLGSVRIGVLCLAFIAGPAAAAPAPLLGPSGPLWLGPLTPETPEILGRGRGLVLVDPETGGLWVQVVDAHLPGPGPDAALERIYREGRWHWSLEEQLTEDRSGVQVSTLTGTRTVLAATSLAQELDTWPIGVTLTDRGLSATRTPDGWEVVGDGLTTLYGPGGWPVHRTDAHGGRVAWERDDGLLVALRRVGGASIQVQFDAQGRLSVLTPPSGRPSYFEHREGRLVRAGPLQQETRYTYDGDGRLETLTWADTSRVQVGWSPSSQVTSLTGPGPRRSALTWTDDGVERRSGPGGPTRLTWTADGYTVQDPGGALVRVQQVDGRLSSWTDPLGASMRVQRGSDGRITSLDGATNWRLQWRNQALTGLTDPLGASWTLGRTGTGQLQRMVDPDGHTLALQHQADGALRSVDVGSQPHRLSWDVQGRLSEVETPNGAVSRLDWTGDRLTATDPAGQAVTLSGLQGAETVLTARTGERWTIDRDSLGRPVQIALPDGQVLRLQRNSLGRLASVGTDDGTEIRYGWRSDGLPSRVTDSLGGETGLDYDPSGRLIGLIRTDGSAVQVGRDARGELVSLSESDREWAVARDAGGHPTALGPLSWVWDAAGRWLGWAARGAALVLRRTGAGAVSSVRWSGGDRIDLDRDATGRTSRVRDAAGTWALEREPGGAVRKLSGPGVAPVVLSRDDRGLVTLLSWGDARRRVLRDAGGRPVKWTASGGAALSIGRPDQQRADLGRFPSGAMAHWTRQPGQAVLELLSPKGTLWLTRALGLDARGRTARVTEGGAVTTTRWDPLGEQVVVEAGDGSWSWLPGRLEGPAGHVVLFDPADRPTVAVPPVGPVAWGLSQDRLSYVLDDHGRMVALSGDNGSLLELEHDDAGRLRALVQDDGRRWSLDWDPFGRLAAVAAPDGSRTVLGQGPDGLLGWHRDGSETEWIAAPGLGWIEASEQGVREVLSDETDSPRIVLEDDGTPQRVTWGPTGMPDRDPGSPLSWHGGWSLFPGGPIVDGRGALDPVSGTRTDPGWVPPWWVDGCTPTAWSGLDTAATPWWDPGPWLATSAWSDPLGLLVRLGELSPVLSPDTPGLPQETAPLPWLPLTARTPDRPLVRSAPGEPPPDPLVALVLDAVVAPTTPLTTADVLDAVLAPEWEGLPSLAGLVAQPERWWLSGLDQRLSGL